MKILLSFFLIFPLFASEFVVKKPLQKKRELRSTLREDIMRSAAELLDGSCSCIRCQTEKILNNSENEPIKQIISVLTRLQQKLLVVTQELLESDSKWIKASCDDLHNILNLFEELIDDLQVNHELSWWQHLLSRLECACPKKR